MDILYRFFSNIIFFGSLLEGSNIRVFDFVYVLNSFRIVKENVRIGSVGIEILDFFSFGNILVVGVGKVLSMGFGIILGSDFIFFNVLGKFFIKRFSFDIKLVVFVLRFGKSDYGRFGGDGFLIVDDGVRFLERNIGVVVFEVVKIDF